MSPSLRHHLILQHAPDVTWLPPLRSDTHTQWTLHKCYLTWMMVVTIARVLVEVQDSSSALLGDSHSATAGEKCVS